MRSNIGYLEVIAGPMYCGKTEELIRQIKRAQIGKKKVQAFKHAIDNRYSTEKKLHSHNGQSHESEKIDSAEELINMIQDDTEIVAIDEAQWFGQDLVPVIQELLNRNKHVIVAGLAMTFDQKPFVPIPTLMAMADKVTKLSSVCTLCGNDAVFHKRMTQGTTVNSSIADPSLVGNLDDYQARCRVCYNKG